MFAPVGTAQGRLFCFRSYLRTEGCKRAGCEALTVFPTCLLDSVLSLVLGKVVTSLVLGLLAASLVLFPRDHGVPVIRFACLSPSANTGVTRFQSPWVP